ncbi:IMP cyclohydrolase [Thermosulfuriphilus sp.]
MKIKRALISVTDKTGVIDFAKALHEMGVEIISTGGTARVIREGGVPVTDVSEVTKFPEMLDGRVKTLHPAIHGGILAIRENVSHMEALVQHGISTIDLVAVNLYAFEKTVASGADLDTAIENIDIGGPTLLRASAKNFRYVTVIVDPADYETVLYEMRENNGATTLKTRFLLARKVFETTSRYDTAIFNYLSSIDPGRALV